MGTTVPTSGQKASNVFSLINQIINFVRFYLLSFFLDRYRPDLSWYQYLPLGNYMELEYSNLSILIEKSKVVNYIENTQDIGFYIELRIWMSGIMRISSKLKAVGDDRSIISFTKSGRRSRGWVIAFRKRVPNLTLVLDTIELGPQEGHHTR